MDLSINVEITEVVSFFNHLALRVIVVGVIATEVRYIESKTSYIFGGMMRGVVINIKFSMKVKSGVFEGMIVPTQFTWCLESRVLKVVKKR